MKDEKYQNIVDFYATTHKLKTLIRTGWKIWNVKAERLESVAEHIYATQMLAFAFASEFELKLDLNKVITMLAFHELGECVVGDITIHDNVTKEQKHNMELKAVTEILRPLKYGNKILELFEEFEEQKTKESIFAHLIDKLECNMQVKVYDENGNTDYATPRTGSMETVRQNGLNEGAKTFAEMWIRSDMKHINYDDNFKKFLEYVLHNNITSGV